MSTDNTVQEDIYRTPAQKEALKKFWETVQWDQMEIGRLTKVISSSVTGRCPIDSIGGNWRLSDGNLGLHPYDTWAIMNAADNFCRNDLEVYYRQNMLGLMAAARLDRKGKDDGA